MRAVRDLWSEMIERRLWPIALLLVAALVAVPVVLAKKPAADDTSADSGAPPAASAASTGGPAPSEPAVSVASDTGADAPLRGDEKNPFEQQHVPRRRTTTVRGFVIVPGGAPPAGGTPGGTGGSTGSGQAPAPNVYTYASIDVRFGRAGMFLYPHGDVPRLTPLPGPARPIVVFMGMRADHETAVFLVSTDVHAQGEGRCVPSKKLCEAIELRRGEIALLDWAEPDGSVTQYELDLVDVTLHQTTSKAAASQAYARTSRVGRRLLSARAGGRARTGAATRGPRPGRIPFRYALQRGVLHIAPWASRSARSARAHGAVSHARLSDVP